MCAPAVLRLLALLAPCAQGLVLRPEAGFAPRRASRRAGSLSATGLRFFSALDNASSKRPLLLMTLESREVVSSGGSFQPSQEFQSAGEFELGWKWQGQRQGHGSELPWGIGAPRTGDNAEVGQFSGMPLVDFGRQLEYSLEAGGNLQSFSSARQDVKIITQVLENVTNGFYLDTHGGDGETNSYTLLLELTGWRGLITEPMIYTYADLWGKMRKAWIFLGCMSPHENATKIGFDWYGKIDENSGHRIHAYPINSFLAEMGGLTTVDFWNLNTGNYEAEVLNETLLYSGSNIEFGVVLISYDGRTAGLGDSRWVQSRSKSETTDLIWSIFQSAGFNYIGGLDAYLTTDTTPSYDYHDHVFVNPAYFTARNIPVPGSIKAAPPPRMAVSSNARNFQGFWDTWDEGLTPDQEVDKMVQYISNAKAAAAATESTPFAHRVDPSHTPAADASGYNPIPSYNPTRPPPMRVA